jgi:hypothetical protein
VAVSRLDSGSWGPILMTSFALAALCNLVEAVADPDGWAWQTLRVALSVVFLIALVGWLVALIRARRARA